MSPSDVATYLAWVNLDSSREIAICPNDSGCRVEFRVKGAPVGLGWGTPERAAADAYAGATNPRRIAAERKRQESVLLEHLRHAEHQLAFVQRQLAAHREATP